MLTINYFVTAYQKESFQTSLKRLYAALGGQNPEEWAKNLYTAFRHDPNNEQIATLNHDRKTCLKLLFELMDAWEESTDPGLFLQEMKDVFQVWRIERILRVCLPMDRAQSLYKMQILKSGQCGMHWYCKLHLAPDTVYAREFPQEQEALKAMLSGYKGSATMNKRIFKLLHTESLGLMRDPSLAQWSRPTQAHPVAAPKQEVKQPPISTVSPKVSQPPPFSEGSIKILGTPLNQNPIRSLLLTFVAAYDHQEFQACITRLYGDLGAQDPEVWARELYAAFREDNSDKRALILNQDRKTCLNLLYGLVDAWEQSGFSPEFERAMVQVFKARRIRRIIDICLVMDRAQAIYKMVLPGSALVGMHWYSSLHVQNGTFPTPEEQERWTHVLGNYCGRGTMNQRLYRLLYSNALGLQHDKDLARWSMPQLTPFFVCGH